jgi:hypothetical protein
MLAILFLRIVSSTLGTATRPGFSDAYLILNRAVADGNGTFRLVAASGLIWTFRPFANLFGARLKEHDVSQCRPASWQAADMAYGMGETAGGQFS